MKLVKTTPKVAPMEPLASKAELLRQTHAFYVGRDDSKEESFEVQRIEGRNHDRFECLRSKALPMRESGDEVGKFGRGNFPCNILDFNLTHKFMRRPLPNAEDVLLSRLPFVCALGNKAGRAGQLSKGLSEWRKVSLQQISVALNKRPKHERIGIDIWAQIQALCR